MAFLELDDLRLHYLDEGDPDAPALVFANSLGTTLHLWDQVLACLPEGLRVVRYDLRGHGQTSCPSVPGKMGALVRDAEHLLDHLGLRDVMFCGLSVGGMIGQGLAVKRLDLVRALVLSNTAAKIGTKKMWRDRSDLVRSGGMEAIADAVMERWFSRGFLRSDALAYWRAMLCGISPEGYAGICAAISGTDFYTPTSGLRLPTLGIAGTEDGATPADLVRETIALIPGARFELIRRAGHLPCVEQPAEFARLLGAFLSDTGHI